MVEKTSETTTLRPSPKTHNTSSLHTTTTYTLGTFPQTEILGDVRPTVIFVEVIRLPLLVVTKDGPTPSSP